MSMPARTPDFSQPWEFSDAILVVEEEQFHVHRAILSMCSPVFQAMFNSGFKEASLQEVPLPGKQADKVHEFLCVIYPLGNQLNEDNDIRSLLELAREYQIPKLQQKCEERLLQKQSTVELILLAQEFQLKRLVEKCVNSLSRMNIQELKEHSRLEEIDAETMISILHGHVRWLKEQNAREARMLRDDFKKERAKALTVAEEMNECWGYNKLPVRGCTCPSYTSSCSICNTVLEKFIKVKCGELVELLQP